MLVSWLEFLRRDDLVISREEEVVNAIFTWNKISKDGHASVGILLQNVHFNSLSIENLLRLGCVTLSGQSGDDLHREVEDALDLAPEALKVKVAFSRRGVVSNIGHHFWAPALPELKLQGERYCPWHVCLCAGTKVNCLLRTWRATASLLGSPVDPAARVRSVAGEGAAVAGINDLFLLSGHLAQRGGVRVRLGESEDSSFSKWFWGLIC